MTPAFITSDSRTDMRLLHHIMRSHASRAYTRYTRTRALLCYDVMDDVILHYLGLTWMDLEI